MAVFLGLWSGKRRLRRTSPMAMTCRTAANTRQQHLCPSSRPAGFPAGRPATRTPPSTIASFGRTPANAQQQPSGSAGGLDVNLARAEFRRRGGFWQNTTAWIIA
jgi:hypothetical protein